MFSKTFLSLSLFHARIVRIPPRLCPVLLLLLFSGCAQLGERLNSQSTLPEQTQETSELPELGENPYLQNIKVPAADVQQQFEAGQKLMTQGRWQQAQAHWELFVKDMPDASGGYLNLGISLAAQDKHDKALAIFDQGIKRNSKNLDLYNQSGLLLRQLGQFEAAESRYKAGLAQWQGYAPLHLNLAILYELYLGEQEKALFHYEQYQRVSKEPDKKVAKWMVDLQRRVDQSASK